MGYIDKLYYGKLCHAPLNFEILGYFAINKRVENTYLCILFYLNLSTLTSHFIRYTCSIAKM